MNIDQIKQLKKQLRALIILDFFILKLTFLSRTALAIYKNIFLSTQKNTAVETPSINTTSQET